VVCEVAELVRASAVCVRVCVSRSVKEHSNIYTASSKQQPLRTLSLVPLCLTISVTNKHGGHLNWIQDGGPHGPFALTRDWVHPAGCPGNALTGNPPFSARRRPTSVAMATPPRVSMVTIKLVIITIKPYFLLWFL